MLGNDVVDLGDPESRAERQHPRFDIRVFDDVERRVIEASPDRERARWCLWAAKESAYKAARKEDPRTVFAPARFAVRYARAGALAVHVCERHFRVDVRAAAEHVHAVARPAGDTLDSICGAVAMMRSAEAFASFATRRFAVVTLAARLGVRAGDLAIQRDGRIPTLWYRGRRTTADLSLSHHGRFVAFACTLPRDLA